MHNMKYCVVWGNWTQA